MGWVIAVTFLVGIWPAGILIIKQCHTWFFRIHDYADEEEPEEEERRWKAIVCGDANILRQCDKRIARLRYLRDLFGRWGFGLEDRFPDLQR